MKLDEETIDDIIEDISDYICDDLWDEIDTEWVEDYLHNNTTNEYDNEDINLILDGAKNCQKEMQKQRLDKEKRTLCQEIDDFINNSNIHLNSTDIGKILVNLASGYLSYN